MGGEVNSLQVTVIFVARSRGVTKQVTLHLDLSLPAVGFIDQPSVVALLLATASAKL